MTIASAVSSTEIRLGDKLQSPKALWLSPLLLGFVAPIVVGLMLLPELLRDAAGFILPLLALVMVVAVGAYVASVLMPVTPVALVVRPGHCTVGVILSSLLSEREVTVPFKEVLRLSAATGSDRDGYQRPQIELKTRDGDVWVIPCAADESELASLRTLMDLGKPRR